MNVGVSEPYLKIRDEGCHGDASKIGRQIKCMTERSAGNTRGKAVTNEIQHNGRVGAECRAAVDMRGARWSRKTREGLAHAKHVGDVIESNRNGSRSRRSIRRKLVRAQQRASKSKRGGFRRTGNCDQRSHRSNS